MGCLPIYGVSLTKRGYVKERIIRTLLNNPTGTLTKYRAAKEAGASYSWAHEVLASLERGGFVEGTKVTDYRGLMLHWLSLRRRPRKRDYMVQDPIRLLIDADMEYAVTSYQGETLVQGYLFPSRVDVYVRGEDQRRWLNLLSDNGLVGKGNVRTLVDDEHVFYNSHTVKNINVVSTPQLILDLLIEGGPSAEAAEMLLGKVAPEHVR